MLLHLQPVGEDDLHLSYHREAVPAARRRVTAGVGVEDVRLDVGVAADRVRAPVVKVLESQELQAVRTFLGSCDCANSYKNLL